MGAFPAARGSPNQQGMTDPFDLSTLDERPRCILAAGNSLGEGPRWHAGEARVYWVDIDACALHRWHPASGAREVRLFDAPVACLAFRARGGLLLGMKDGCATIDDWDAPVVRFGPQVLAGKPNHRMNDGRTDPAGRFWVGDMNGAKDVADATLWRLDGDGDLQPVESGMMTCNGAAFTTDGRFFAHSNTPSHAIRLYDCDPAAGTLTDRRIFHQFERGVGPGLGRPDGGSFDEDGCYWAAMFDGWRVVRLAPDGTLLAEVGLPVQRPTMIAFGGADRRTAFVTSATTGIGEEAQGAQPLAGGLFAFRVETPGVVETPFAG